MKKPPGGRLDEHAGGRVLYTMMMMAAIVAVVPWNVIALHSTASGGSSSTQDADSWR
jgi:hypothetical protein